MSEQTPGRDQHGDGDPDLVSLVQMANAFGIEQSVVLTLPGLTVCGTLVSGRSYFEGLAVAVQGVDPDETLRGSLGARFRRRSEDLAAWGSGSKLGDLDPDTPAAEDLPEMPAADYLHLRDASVTPGPDGRLPLWRGRIGDVVGWTLGGFED